MRASSPRRHDLSIRPGTCYDVAMDFGIAFPTYVDAWRDAEVAEANGFSHAWFYDSQLLYADVWAAMALAAEHTTTMTLGTLVAIPSNRIAPVTAAAAATINALAPGRVVLGLGTGFTGRNTMGMPALPVARLVEYVEQVRGLLAGEDVLFREGRYERWIRLLQGAHGRTFVNLDDPIPIHVAANGPRALEAAGQVGDGWITVPLGADAVRESLLAVTSAAQAIDRAFDGGAKPYTTALTTACVVRDGETLRSPRVLARVGPVAIVPLHAMWESARGGADFGLDDTSGAAAYDAYIDARAEERGSPPDRRYLDVHESHMVALKPGEEAFLDDGLVSFTLTGRPDEVRERIRQLANAGVDNLAVQAIPGQARELIEEFATEVIARL
jgi:5,10-methylenetetrahydromethanopterin reductase